jgi:hypothetical protein
MIWLGNMLDKLLKLLAIPAGFEPATIGLEGPKQTVDFRAFAGYGLPFWTAFLLRKPG